MPLVRPVHLPCLLCTSHAPVIRLLVLLLRLDVQEFYKAGGKLPDRVWNDILAAVAEVEAAYGAKFADPHNPLLFSVRSGAAVSMPVRPAIFLTASLHPACLPLARSAGWQSLPCLPGPQTYLPSCLAYLAVLPSFLVCAALILFLTLAVSSFMRRLLGRE